MRGSGRCRGRRARTSRTSEAIQIGLKMSGKLRLLNGTNRYSQGGSFTVRPSSAASAVAGRLGGHATRRTVCRPERRSPDHCRDGRRIPRPQTSSCTVLRRARERWRGLRRLRALLSVANRDGIAGFARELLGLGVEIYATDGTREHLAGEGIEVALGHRADRASRRWSAARSRPSTPRSTPGSSPAATCPTSWPSSRRNGSA